MGLSIARALVSGHAGFGSVWGDSGAAGQGSRAHIHCGGPPSGLSGGIFNRSVGHGSGIPVQRAVYGAGHWVCPDVAGAQPDYGFCDAGSGDGVSVFDDQYGAGHSSPAAPPRPVDAACEDLDGLSPAGDDSVVVVGVGATGRDFGGFDGVLWFAGGFCDSEPDSAVQKTGDETGIVGGDGGIAFVNSRAGP